jgi:CheY-like chemotaxis protein
MARRLRTEHRLARAPIVLMSGDARELQRLEPAADAVLLKPFDPEQLVETLEKVCRAGPKGSEP